MGRLTHLAPLIRNMDPHRAHYALVLFTTELEDPRNINATREDILLMFERAVLKAAKS